MNPNNSDAYLTGTIVTPSSLVITNITNDYPCEVTVNINPATASNTYMEGQLVKLMIPYIYGMFQANGQISRVISNENNVITLDLDTRNFDIFNVPFGNVTIPASLSPSGARNLELNNETRLVPFQSLNNRGN